MATGQNISTECQYVVAAERCRSTDWCSPEGHTHRGTDGAPISRSCRSPVDDTGHAHGRWRLGYVPYSPATTRGKNWRCLPKVVVRVHCRTPSGGVRMKVPLAPAGTRWHAIWSDAKRVALKGDSLRLLTRYAGNARSDSDRRSSYRWSLPFRGRCFRGADRSAMSFSQRLITMRLYPATVNAMNHMIRLESRRTV